MPIRVKEETIQNKQVNRPSVERVKEKSAASYSSTAANLHSSNNLYSNGSIKLLPDHDTTTPMKSSLRDSAMGSPPRTKRFRCISLNRFRVPIYIQLCLVICILCGICVMVVAVATYTNDRTTILDQRGENLVTIAVMKSVQLNQTLGSLYNQIYSVSTRVLIQQALASYYTSSNSSTDMQFGPGYNDFATAIGTQSTLLAGRVYDNDFNQLPNFTVSTVTYDFPESLYPTAIPPTPPGGTNTSAGEILGPLAISESPGLYVISMTVPITNLNSGAQPLILGYLSMITTATGLLRAVNDSTGMGQTGQTLLVGRNGSQYQILLPPLRTPQFFGQVFNISVNPAVEATFQNQTGYLINTHNAVGTAVSVGYTLPSLRFNVGWGVIAEQLKSEVYEPVDTQQRLAAITSVVPYTAVCILISLIVIILVKSIRDLSRANKVTLRALDNDDEGSSRILPDPVKERTWWFQDEISDVQRSHNIMRDQLLKQYESLEDQVRKKTAELHGKMEELEVALAQVEEEKMNTQNALQVKEEALATQERLMHSVAHDLKTPLNGILAPIESWLDNPEFTGEQKAELKDAFLSVKRLKRLTEDLTKYAEDVRFGRLNPQIFTLGVLQSQTSFDFQTQCIEKNLLFNTEFIPESAADWQVYGDYYRISQIVNNFIHNAIKFTMPGGRIQLRIRARGKLEKPKPRTDHESTHSGGSMTRFAANFSDDSSGSGRAKEGLDWQIEYFEFEVEDNGIGIADEDLGKIFEPWHQLKDDKAHNENYGGIGLGLAICQFWVTKMDGKIDVTSRRAGSTNERGCSVFKILIPLRVNRLSRRNSTNSSKLSIKTNDSGGASTSSRLVRPPIIAPIPKLDAQSLNDAITSAIPNATLKASQKQMCRILIAEDEPINQRVVQRMLIKDGFRLITFAQNGFQAIEAVSRAQEAGKQFNLILMDFQMPHVDGPLAATVIRRIPNITQDRLTIIALTAYDDDKSKRDCLAAGMNDFITKPISHAILREVLAKHLSLPSVPEGEEEEEEEEGAGRGDSFPLSPASPPDTSSVL